MSRPSSAVVGRWLLIAIAALFAARTLRSDWLLAAPRRLGQTGDISVWLGALRHLGAGGRLYDWVDGQGYGFTYPPFAALVLRPLTWAPALEVGRAWLLLTLALAVLVPALVIARGRSPWTLAWLLAAVGLFAGSVQVQSEVITGQINLLLALLLVLDLGEVVPERWRGVLTGLAAAIKLTPLVAVAWLLCTRQWASAGRAVGAFVVAGTVGAVALPRDSLAFWTDAVLDTSRVGDLASSGNVSVSGVLARAGVDGALHTLLWLGLGTLVVVAALARAAQAHERRDPIAVVVLLGCAAVVASPISWPHHQIWLPLAGLVLIGRWRPMPSAAGAVIVLVSFFHTPISRVFDRAGPLAPVLGEIDLLLFVLVCAFGLATPADARTRQPRPVSA